MNNSESLIPNHVLELFGWYLLENVMHLTHQRYKIDNEWNNISVFATNSIDFSGTAAILVPQLRGLFVGLLVTFKYVFTYFINSVPSVTFPSEFHGKSLATSQAHPNHWLFKLKKNGTPIQLKPDSISTVSELWFYLYAWFWMRASIQWKLHDFIFFVVLSSTRRDFSEFKNLTRTDWIIRKI